MRGLFYIVMLIVAAGCCSVHELDEMALNSAEELLEENPRAAYDRLGAMNISDFSDSATMARWALLYSESMAMSRMHVPTDTIVNIAVGVLFIPREAAGTVACPCGKAVATGGWGK